MRSFMRPPCVRWGPAGGAWCTGWRSTSPCCTIPSTASLITSAWQRRGAHQQRSVCAPRSQGGLPVGCTLPLEGAGLVVWFAGRPPVPSRPGELHPLGELLLSTVFQHFSGLEIDLHRSGLSCAHRALLRFLKNFNG